MIKINGKYYHTQEEKNKMSEIKKAHWQDKEYYDMQINARKNSEAYQNKKYQQRETLLKTYDEHPEIKEQISKTLKKMYKENPEIGEEISKRTSKHHADEDYRKQISETKNKLIKENPEKFSEIGRKGGLASRKNQKSPSSIEVILANELDKQGICFIQQKIMLDKYRVDFLIDDDWLVVEADGDYWHRLPNIVEKDIIRDKILKENGFITLRFWEHEIKSDVSSCVEKIKKHLKKL